MLPYKEHRVVHNYTTVIEIQIQRLLLMTHILYAIPTTDSRWLGSPAVFQSECDHKRYIKLASEPDNKGSQAGWGRTTDAKTALCWCSFRRPGNCWANAAAGTTNLAGCMMMNWITHYRSHYQHRKIVDRRWKRFYRLCTVLG